MEIVDPVNQMEEQLPNSNKLPECEFCGCLICSNHIILSKDDFNVDYCNECYLTNKEELLHNGWNIIKPETEETYKCQLCEQFTCPHCH